MALNPEAFRDLKNRFIFQGGSEFAIQIADEFERLQKDVVHWREARRSCIEAGDMMKEEIERLREETGLLRDRALRFAIDEAGIEKREADAVELDVARTEIERLRKLLHAYEELVDHRNAEIERLRDEEVRLTREVGELRLLVCEWLGDEPGPPGESLVSRSREAVGDIGQ